SELALHRHHLLAHVDDHLGAGEIHVELPHEQECQSRLVHVLVGHHRLLVERALDLDQLFARQYLEIARPDLVVLRDLAQTEIFHSLRFLRGLSPYKGSSSSTTRRTLSPPFRGTCTCRRTYRSPVALPLGSFTPRPRSRKRWPLWLPGGTFTLTSPPGVGTVTEAPSAASPTVTGTSKYRSRPRRSRNGCGRRWTLKNRSPAGPPFCPGSPLPASRIFDPSSTPGGIFTLMRSTSSM